MGLPVTVDLKPYRGDTWSQVFRFKRGAAPVDLTGATVEAEARNREGESFALVAELSDAALGEVTLRLPPESIPPAPYTYDLEIAEDGEVTTWIRGRLDVRRDVTNELPL
jgi:hypothetical protein